MSWLDEAVAIGAAIFTTGAVVTLLQVLRSIISPHDRWAGDYAELDTWRRSEKWSNGWTFLLLAIASACAVIWLGS